MHLPIKFDAMSLSSPELLTFFRNWRWRPPPSLISRLCEFGHPYVLIMWYLCFVPNLVQISDIVTEIDAHYALDFHLMTSRELTFDFDFRSCGHLRMAMMHLPIKFGAYILIQSGLIDIFPKLKMAAVAILDFQSVWIWPHTGLYSVAFVLFTKFGSNVCYSHLDRRTYIDIFPKFKMAVAAIFDFQFLWIWASRRVDSMVFMFCAKFGLNVCYSHWDRRTYATDLHLMTSRELTSDFDFWSRDHLRMAVMHLATKFGADICFLSKAELLIFFWN